MTKVIANKNNVALKYLVYFARNTNFVRDTLYLKMRTHVCQPWTTKQV